MMSESGHKLTGSEIVGEEKGREEKEHREEIWRRQFGWRFREDKIGQPNNEGLSNKKERKG